MLQVLLLSVGDLVEMVEMVVVLLQVVLQCMLVEVEHMLQVQ
jgi:hypothetical protein